VPAAERESDAIWTEVGDRHDRRDPFVGEIEREEWGLGELDGPRCKEGRLVGLAAGLSENLGWEREM
jgi:hypothetical protein